MQVSLEKADWLTTKGALHLPHAAVTEVQTYKTMAVVVFLSELVKPAVDERRDTALLGAN